MFNQLEQTLTTLQEQGNNNARLLSEILTRLNGGIDPDEKPINGKEIMKRLNISEPTLIRMRKQKRIPFMNVGGVIRYDWHEVKKALANK